MKNVATIRIGKKHHGLLDSKQFEKLLRAELARDRDLHIEALELSFVNEQDTSVTVNHRQDNEQAKTILNAVIRIYFQLSAEASMLTNG
jgi:hypothetical protein